MNWSLSKWNTYKKCAAQYKFRYILNLPSERSASAGRGVELHLAMELFIKGEMPELPPEINFYTQFITNLRENPEYTLKPEFKVALNDKWEPVPWGDGNWWRGVIDLLTEYPAGVIVYDWKTGKEYDDHIDQRELYSAAVLAHYPHVDEVNAVHVYLDSKVNRQTMYHRNQLGEIQTKWADRAKLMQTDNDYIPYPGYHCRWCSYSRAKGGPCRF